MKKIIILGTGGNCIDILDTLFDINDTQSKKVYECVGFLDDNPSKWDQLYHGVKVLGPLLKANELNDCYFVFGIGSTSNYWKRKDILIRLGIDVVRFETVIHPTASVSRMAMVGCGSVVFQNVTVNSNVIIGRHVYILPNCVISHDTVVGDFTCIAAGVNISGKVNIGQGCYIGTNSAIRDGITIGDNCLIGMGSVVLKDVPDNNVVVGNPARFLRFTKPVSF
jgi:sugar O-acyltransferase (sialic acid O-acetyltransferase NeuD family)